MADEIAELCVKYWGNTEMAINSARRIRSDGDTWAVVGDF